MKEKLKREGNKKKYKMGDKWKDMIKKGREALGREGDGEKKQKQEAVSNYMAQRRNILNKNSNFFVTEDNQAPQGGLAYKNGLCILKK